MCVVLSCAALVLRVTQSPSTAYLLPIAGSPARLMQQWNQNFLEHDPCKDDDDAAARVVLQSDNGLLPSPSVLLDSAAPASGEFRNGQAAATGEPYSSSSSGAAAGGQVPDSPREAADAPPSDAAQPSAGAPTHSGADSHAAAPPAPATGKPSSSDDAPSDQAKVDGGKVDNGTALGARKEPPHRDDIEWVI